MFNKILSHFGLMKKIDHLDQMELFRTQCKGFAEENLYGRSATVKSGGRVVNAGRLEAAHLTIIGDGVVISDSFVKRIEVAPWCKNCFIQAVHQDQQ